MPWGSITCWHEEITYIVLWNPHRLARCVLLFHFSDEETETGSFRTSVGVAWGAACMLSPFIHVQLYETPWTAACQSPLSMGFSSQEYWSGLPCPSPGDPLNPRIKPMPPALQQILYRWATGEAFWSCYLANQRSQTFHKTASWFHHLNTHIFSSHPLSAN